MKHSGTFRKYGEIDVGQLRACVESQPESAWHESDYRQTAYDVHRDTHTIYLLFDKDFRHFDITRMPKYAEFSEVLKPLIQTLSSYFEYQGWAVRCILTRLKAGGKINPHADQGFSLRHAHRFHVPIITNEGVRFTVGEETIHMRAGEIWEIDNRRMHAVENLGAEARVHLIMDWAEPITHEELRRYGADRQRHYQRQKMGLQHQYD